MLEPSIGPQDLAAELARLRKRLGRERSSRLEAETIAEKGLRDLYEKQQQLQLLEAIAAAANEATSVRDITLFAITQVCQYTHWQLGHVYFIHRDSNPKRLVPASIWYSPDAPRFQAFYQATAHTDIIEDVGLPGRVLASGAPAWIAEVAKDSNFPRASAAEQVGLKAAFAFPVLVGSEVVAVLEFFADQVLEPDQTLLRLMRQIGTQLGRTVERKRSEEQLIHDASHDPLTGLPNRALLTDRLERALARIKRHPEYQFAVLFIDLDRFKVINDSLGHLIGDHLIIQVATRLLGSLRREDVLSRPSFEGKEEGTLARLGGDEFVLLLEYITDPSDAVRVADRIQSSLKLPFFLGNEEVYASASIGIALSATGHPSADDILRAADLAMYRAKALGKARSEIYDETLHDAAVKRLKLETDLRHALQKQEFVVYYQPIVSLISNEIVGFEALVRWRRSDSEIIAPGEFISVMEDTGLILFLGLWVLREACDTIRKWNDDFPREKPLTMSVNLSARQFAQADLVERIGNIIAETGVQPETLRLEITESVTMADAERAVRVISQLRKIGVRISIDDFGTGYSSLSYLQKFPLDALKIDRSFVSQMDNSNEGLQIIQTIMSLARNLGMDVIAEGIEKESHVSRLKSLSCDYGQGYHFSRPVDAAAAYQLLSSGKYP